MPNYRRYYLPHRPVFVTLVTHARQPWLTTDDHIAWLRMSWQRVKTQHPFRHIAHVILPDHMHWLFEPTGESNFSAIVAAFKRDVTWSLKRTHASKGLSTRQLWQARFNGTAVWMIMRCQYWQSLKDCQSLPSPTLHHYHKLNFLSSVQSMNCFDFILLSKRCVGRTLP